MFVRVCACVYACACTCARGQECVLRVLPFKMHTRHTPTATRFNRHMRAHTCNIVLILLCTGGACPRTSHDPPLRSCHLFGADDARCALRCVELMHSRGSAYQILTNLGVVDAILASVHRNIHPSTYPSIHPFVPSARASIDLFIHSLIHSLIRSPRRFERHRSRSVRGGTTVVQRRRQPRL